MTMPLPAAAAGPHPLFTRLLDSVTCRWGWHYPNVRRGSGCHRRLFEFIAVKPPLEFRYPEAAICDRVQTTLNGHWPILVERLLSSGSRHKLA